MNTVTLQFLGAAGTVTGSRHLLSTGDRDLLVDCGLFQGRKELRLKNWEPFPIPPKDLDAVGITHAHLDHSGYLPRLVTGGFHGLVYCSRPTADLLGILLPDAAHLQEEDAEFANKKGFSKHAKALPLYTAEDAQDALRHLRPVMHKQVVQMDNGFQFHFHNAGHILGSKFLHVTADGVRVLFTGDVGRYRASGGKPETLPDPADYLVMESTYGDRLHPKDDVRPRLAKVIQETVKQGGTVVIPAFAVERTQRLLFLIRSLMEEGQIPSVPIHIDSPMAIEAVKIFMRYSEEFDEETKAMVKRLGSPLNWPQVHFDKTVEESKQASSSRYPAIIISSSGMATGGRVLHHLAQRLPDHRNTVLFVGFQAPETRGRLICDGAGTVKIHGEEIPVRARIERFEEFSDHADYEEMLRWLESFPGAPKQVFLVHGEPEAARALEQRIEKKFGWGVHVAQPGEKVALH
ncbi:MAG: MBL fold metallo-hydrolase [Acidobacteria bacterium]|nr:MBL fold metallo-hydrolase [Acidobacteriota bacterium]